MMTYSAVDLIVLLIFSEDGEIFSDVQSAVNSLSDNFESVMGTLGLSERKPVPDPVVFEESDALGISLMSHPHNSLTAFIGLGKVLGTCRIVIHLILFCLTDR